MENFKDVNEFDRDIKSLYNYVQIEWEKWVISNKKCKTFLHISKVSSILFGIGSVGNNQNYIFLGKGFKLTEKHIGDCFKLRRTKDNTETKEILLKKKSEAITLYKKIFCYT